MITDGMVKAIAGIFLAFGAFAASDVAMHYREPFLALGYILVGLGLLAISIRSLLQPF